MSKKAIVLLAEGFEEVEAVTPIDYLRRAGVEVTTAAVGGAAAVKGARGIQVIADTTLAELSGGAGAFDAIVVPGGIPGATNLAASKEVSLLLTDMAAAGKLVCAICAAPAAVLAPLGLLSEKKFTCYPGIEKQVSNGSWSEDKVVIDGHIITSRSAGTAGDFAVAIISKLIDEPAGKKIADAVLL